jgi:oxygen-independent coproporphyrinogen III oxidase
MAGIYLHIPFCKQACTYCNFHFSTSSSQKDAMLKAMLLEMEMQKDYLQGESVNTVYFGGGTPSLLSADDINRFMDTIMRHYNVTDLQECTLEANPDDLSNTYLRSLKTTSVNRLSIGVQSFHDADLVYMHRAHSAAQADYVIKAAQDIGFPTLSIDLIYGVPGLTDAGWKQNLSLVRDLQIPHFSSYALTVEEGTILHHQIKTKKTAPVDAHQSARQFEILMEQAAVMGFDHYEISNFGLPGHHAIHNTNYWRGITYVGIGPSAHSFNGTSRQWNVANNALYLSSLSQQTIPSEVEKLTPVQQLNEYIMTSLRTMWGCDINKVADTWGSFFADQLKNNTEPFLDRNWLIIQDQKIILTHPGKLMADHIASELFFDEQAIK